MSMAGPRETGTAGANSMRTGTEWPKWGDSRPSSPLTIIFGLSRAESQIFLAK
ncbi:hypothetical protein [Croceicoccus marinus]|uniref:hypothetical protein n=1 Tax=Croceicoccus marinus TaxID=450378 RepID=UPI000AEECA5C|nr:hypothetical protein [Croceicoccus marinus]